MTADKAFEGSVDIETPDEMVKLRGNWVVRGLQIIDNLLYSEKIQEQAKGLEIINKVCGGSMKIEVHKQLTSDIQKEVEQPVIPAKKLEWQKKLEERKKAADG